MLDLADVAVTRKNRLLEIVVHPEREVKGVAMSVRRGGRRRGAPRPRSAVPFQFLVRPARCDARWWCDGDNPVRKPEVDIAEELASSSRNGAPAPKEVRNVRTDAQCERGNRPLVRRDLPELGEREKDRCRVAAPAPESCADGNPLRDPDRRALHRAGNGLERRRRFPAKIAFIARDVVRVGGESDGALRRFDVDRIGEPDSVEDGQEVMETVCATVEHPEPEVELRMGLHLHGARYEENDEVSRSGT